MKAKLVFSITLKQANENWRDHSMFRECLGKCNGVRLPSRERSGVILQQILLLLGESEQRFALSGRQEFTA
jgi:hypothetical protein